MEESCARTRVLDLCEAGSMKLKTEGAGTAVGLEKSVVKEIGSRRSALKALKVEDRAAFWDRSSSCDVLVA